MPIGSKIIHLNSVDSTNNYAAMLVTDGKASHGDVILADEQTAGRGQRGSDWQSEGGSNLLLSVILKPDNMSVDRQFVLTQLVSLAVLDLLRKIGISARIKWPNDIYIGDKKISGMLIENSLSGGFIHTSIVGVGLNVNQGNFALDSATSIKLETGESRNIQEVLFSFISSLNEQYQKWLFQGGEEINANYCEQLLGIGELRTYEDSTGEFQGVLSGVEANGRLRLRVDGKERTYDMKEIRFIFRNAF